MTRIIKLLLLISLAFYANAVNTLKSQTCKKSTTETDCINSLNDDLTDKTKCLPIVPVSSQICASWRDVQNNNNKIDYKSNQNQLSTADKSHANLLVYFIKFARYSYDAKAGETTVLKDLQIFTDSKLNTQSVMGYDPVSNSIVSSFRGSSNIMNWLSDFDFIKTPYVAPGCNNCQVHQGFYNSYNSLAKQMNAYLPTLANKYKGANIVVTGHSLGGGQAVIGALDQQQQGYSVNLYTYGQPRVGEINFVNYLDSTLKLSNMRAVYFNDPVPTVPYVIMNFIHGSTEMHLYECSQTAYVVYPSYTDDDPYSDLLAVNDHEGYWCVMNASSIESDQEDSQFLQ